MGDIELAGAVARGLRRDGMVVDVATDGDEGYRRATSTRYDVVVLDQDLPGMTGDELCRRLVVDGVPTRILMLTASDTDGGRLTGLALGADDHLATPFAFAELVARVRRLCPPASSAILMAGDIELDSARRTVTRAGEPIDLTPKEFGLLQRLLMATGHVAGFEEFLARAEPLVRAWAENTDPFTTTVRATMMTLRRKLGEP